MNTPTIKVKSAGRVSGTLEGIADAFRRANPKMEVRWIYSPEHQPSLSGVMGRMSEGYQMVVPSDFGDDLPFGLKSDAKEIRVADTVLMKIPASERQRMEIQRAAVATEAQKSVDRNFYSAIEGMSLPGASAEHQPRPRGSSSIHLKEFEYDVHQKDGREE